MSFWTDFKRGWNLLGEDYRKWRSERREKAALRKSAKNRPWNLYLSLLALLLIGIGYFAWTASAISPAYVDLGDGNYLYTSSRIADGKQIYKDFLSPQPPMHLLTGSLLIRLGDALESALPNAGSYETPMRLAVVRVFSILLRLATASLLFLIGWRLCQTPYGGLAAFVLYLLLPIGFWWSQGYQSEPLEMFFLMLALWLFLPLRPLPMAAAGLLMALGTLTNMTAAPYALALLVYLIVRHAIQGGRAGRVLTLAYFVPLALVLMGVVAYYETTTGAYIRNVWSNQVSSYPPLDYALGKLFREGISVLLREGGFICLALLGLMLYNRSDAREEREFFVWYALVLLLSVVHVMKGGTMDYIFTIGEPVVALFAAFFIVQFFHPGTWKKFGRSPLWQDTSIVPQACFALLLMVAVAAPGIGFIHSTWKQEQVEQKAEGVRRLTYLIRQHSEPDEPILAPPYYAFISERRLAEEFSELFLWMNKYTLERQADQVGEAVLTIRKLEKSLLNQTVPIVVANTNRPLLLRAPEIVQALEKNYTPLLKEEEKIHTRNFELQVFVRKQ